MTPLHGPGPIDGPGSSRARLLRLRRIYAGQDRMGMASPFLLMEDNSALLKCQAQLVFNQVNGGLELIHGDLRVRRRVQGQGIEKLPALVPRLTA